MTPIELTLISWPVVAILAFIGGRLQERAKASALRPVVATALLTEIQSLEIGLRRLALHQQAARSTVYPDTSNYEAFRTQLVLLPPEVAQALIVFYGLVHEVNSSRKRMKDEEVQLTSDAHAFIRAKARFAANRIPDLRQMLEATGGRAIPAGDPTWVPNDSLVPLVEPAFDTTRLVPGTSEPPNQRLKLPGAPK